MRDNFRHGLSRTPTWRAWSKMRAKGVPICPGWEDFTTFLEDMGLAPAGKPALALADPALGFHPGNVRWEEKDNARADCLRITIHGKTQTIAQWAREYGIPRRTLYMRVKSGKRKGSDLLAHTR